MHILTAIPAGYVAYASGLWARPDFLEHDPSRRIGECGHATASVSLPVPARLSMLDCSEPKAILEFDYTLGGTLEDRAVADAVWLRNANLLIDYSTSSSRCGLLRLGAMLLKRTRRKQTQAAYAQLRERAADKWHYRDSQSEERMKCF